MILQSRRVWVLNDWLKAQIQIEDGKIRRIFPYGEKKADAEYGDLRVVPGFIDVHTHGAYGFDTNDAEPEGLRSWAENLVREGVTGFLPTMAAQSEKVLTAALQNAARLARAGQEASARETSDRRTIKQRASDKNPSEREASYEGARILGIHLEGPFLDRTYRGAQPEEYCVKPDPAQFERYWEASQGLIRIVTMACEHDEGYALTRSLAKRGIVVSLGHSSASCEQAALAFANGARSVTHVYNGMAPFHHRDPGIVGASFCFSNVFGEVICDGRHSAWAALHGFFAAKGPDCGVMITDSLSLKGMPAGTRALFCGNHVVLGEDGAVRLADTGGLAGSSLRMNEGLRNLVEKAGVPWQTAINACTCNPARLIGMEKTRGTLQAGKTADIVVLGDDYSVKETYVCGKRYLF